MPRFVLLYHECPVSFGRASHWDLMLESRDKLRTWALAQLPRAWEIRYGQAGSASDSVAAKRLADHRLDYLDFEGPLSGDRGTVTRIDAGTYVTDEETCESLRVNLTGQTLRGAIVLKQNQSSTTSWTLTTLSGGWCGKTL